MTTQVLRYAAFTVDGGGGNPAGVVLDARGLDAADMQAIAADVGYSETAFLVARPDEPNGYDVRYFSPKREVPFCGHATIASAVALAELSPAAELVFYTPAGVVSVATWQNDSGELVAELTSVAPRVSEPEPDLVAAVLHALRWLPEDLDPDYPVRLANAGSEHLVLVVKTRNRLADLDYDFDVLAKLMRDHGLVTVQLVWPESKKRYHPQPLRRQRSRRGSRHRRISGSIRRLPARAGSDRGECTFHDHPGRGHGPPERDQCERHRGRTRRTRQRHGPSHRRLIRRTAAVRRSAARLPVDVERTPLVIAGVGLHADHCQLMELLEGGGAGVGAAAAQAGHDGINEILDARTLRIQIHPPGRDALLEQCRTRPIEARGVLGAHLHRARRGHPVRLLVHPTFRVGHQVAGALIRPGEPRADHDAAGPGRQRERDVPRVAYAAVGPDRSPCCTRRLGALQDSAELRPPDTSHHPSGAHRARPDSDLDDVRAGTDQVVDSVG